MKKIFRRINKVLKSLPHIILAIIFERKKHPWKMIFDSFILSSNNFQLNSSKYIYKYFRFETKREKTFINFNGLYIHVPESQKSNEHYLYTILVLYYDIVYPKQCKYPVPNLINEGPYEEGEVSLTNEDVVMDIGANVGFFSLYAATKGVEKVYAFEPIKDLAVDISVGLKANGVSNVQVVEKAVSNTTGSEDLFYSPSNFGGASKEIEIGTKNSVLTTTIDEFVKTENIKKISFIKMDIEGMEPEALQGALSTLRSMKPKLAICTYHHPDHPRLIRDIILSSNPEYQTLQMEHKIFAW
jgi:FkbM family methyltransferase